MSTGSTIEHLGIVESIGDDGIKVRFTALSACASCHAKGYCSASDMEEKQISIPFFTGNYLPGETVNVVMERSLGFKALSIAYVFPFLMIISLLLIFSAAGMGELQSGLLALSSLLPYYSIVYLSRKRIDKKFNFSIRKIYE